MHKWFNFIIQKPLITYLFTILLCFIGLFALYSISIAPFPLQASSKIKITVMYPGANAEVVQAQVTKKIVDQLLSVPNIKTIRAESMQSSSYIHIQLISNHTDVMNQAQIDISRALSAVTLPSSVNAPELTTATGSSGLMAYEATSDTLSLFDLNNFIESELVPKFKTMPGVSVEDDNMDPVIHIYLDPEKMALYHLDPNSVAADINNAYKDSPLGSLNLGAQTYMLNLSHSIKNINDFSKLPVGFYGDKPGRVILLSDVADVSFGPTNHTLTYYSGFNGKKSQSVELDTTTGANPFAVSSQVESYVHDLMPLLPAGIKLLQVDNAAKLMKASFTEVGIAVVLASVLVLLIALIFLGRFRVTIIPVVVIPICLLGAVLFLSILGMTLNILTLLAMVIAVGLVVDDAIVVVENITRYIEEGSSKFDAVIKGTSSIALTICGITATLLVVYLPVSLCEGAIPHFLKAFTLPLASAVFISGILALTLTPVLCLLLLTDAKPNRYQQIFNKTLNAIINGYHNTLNATLRFPWLSLILCLVLVLTGAYYSLKLPKTLFPADPSGSIHIVMMASPHDTVATLKTKLDNLRHLYASTKIKYTTTNISDSDDYSSTPHLNGRLRLYYKEQYRKDMFAIANQLTKKIKATGIKNITVKVAKAVNMNEGPDVGVELYGIQNIAKLNAIVSKLKQKLKSNHIFANTYDSVAYPAMQLSFDINLKHALKMGITQASIKQLLSVYYSGYQLDNNISVGSLSVPIRVSMANNQLQDVHSLQGITIYSPVTKTYLPIVDFVKLHLSTEAPVINSFDGNPSVILGADLASGQSLDKGIGAFKQVLTKYAPMLHYQFEGQAENYLTGNQDTLLIAILGIIGVYILLTLIFQNLLDPLIIMLTVPFSTVGGALVLYLVGGSINLFSSLALITLVGLITKHGVLIVQFANEKLHDSSTIKEAILSATRHRFRPIIMTTLAMSMGALPLVLAHPMMYVSRFDLGIVLISGLLIGTLFSLFVVPIVYTLVKKAEQHLHLE